MATQLSLSPASASPVSLLDPEHCYRALVARDSRFDGVFFIGVKTTGVYCRPVCAVRTARASSCTYYSSAAAAEAAGFRPCLRCRPELAPYALQQNLAYGVWQKIAAGALNDGNVERLAAEIGLSSRQLRRVLLQHFGVTPVELAQTQRLLFAKKLLQETGLPMTDVAYAAGFGSVRRFNALFAERYKLAPGSIRRASATDSEGIVLRLAYRPPYAWAEVLQYLAARAMPGLEAVLDGKSEQSYVRSVSIGDKQGWLQVKHVPDKQQLSLQVAPQLAPVLMPLLAKVRNLFDLDANPLVMQSYLQTDALLAAQIQRTPGLRVPGAFDAFELAIRAILGQQVSVAGASTVAGRLVQRFGTPIATPFAEVSHHFPGAALLAQTAPEDIAQIGLTKSRAATIRNLAVFVVQGGLQLPAGISLEDAVARLKTVAGVGEWTAQYIALRALRFADAFPAGDLALQKAAAVAPDTRMTEKQLLARAHPWSPWRSYAALLLWQSLSNKD
ncbi:AlkA N-terminal domain-containing protein [Undibacterium sp.]|uniref:AlkA N-terminal domain-containing protein n=1 Tax=Undibacterium sp. TaxID=1914977 RepID=UPI002D08F39B|nr:AlkA N-terminal domain-containing protein [Undibacterium sp.]HTD06330.1 AlkA N-terminal domain-containing protein [Undibacterium sp.]